jgi:hypothetical protein
MLSRREHQAWFQNHNQDIQYRTEEERKFFEAIKNPPAPTEELKEIVREFGFVIRKD